MFRFNYAARSLFVAAFFVFAAAIAPAVSAQDTLAKWEAFDFAKSRIQPADLAAVPLEDLKVIRGIVFGKHGRIFKDYEIRGYLRDKTWYQPDEGFTNSRLNETERRNLDV